MAGRGEPTADWYGARLRQAQALCEQHEAGRLGLAEESRWLYVAYLRATGRLSEYPEQTEKRGDVMSDTDYVIGPGFQARIDELGLRPLGNEVYFAPGYSMVLTDQGPLWYSQSANEVVGPFAGEQ